METVETPLQIAEGSAKEQTAAFSRDLLLLFAALPALIAVFGKKDVTAIVAYIASAEFAPALGVIVGAVVIVWRQWLTRRAKLKLVTLRKEVDDSVVIVR